MVRQSRTLQNVPLDISSARLSQASFLSSGDDGTGSHSLSYRSFTHMVFPQWLYFLMMAENVFTPISHISKHPSYLEFKETFLSKYMIGIMSPIKSFLSA